MQGCSTRCGGWFIQAGYAEVVLPAIWEAGTFLGKMGQDKESLMWTFEDRGGRAVCLVPEVTGMMQEMWNSGWSRSMPKPARLFYVSRCYRYDRPQAGRYREFTQFGVECMGPPRPGDRDEIMGLLEACLQAVDVDYEVCDGVRRGIGYYVEDGFEAECSVLGAQKQVAGGGRYREGIGWALGVDRLMLACNRREDKTPALR